MNRRRGLWMSGLVLVVTLLFVGSAGAEWIELGTAETGVRVVEQGGDRIVVEFTLAGMEKGSVDINGKTHATYDIPGMTVLRNQGEPQLPIVREALIIPDQSEVVARILEVETVRLPTEPVAPSKGVIYRNINPASVPYIFGNVYDRAESFPADKISLEEPFIIRDMRGSVLEIRPVIYTPVLEELEVVTRLEVEIVKGAGPGLNTIDREPGAVLVDRDFAMIYNHLFLNGGPDRYVPIQEPGRCLIISYDSFQTAAEQLYEWKLQKGIPTTLTYLSSIGSTANDVMNYLQSMYDSPEGLTYIVLIGDSQQIPYFIGYQGDCSDPVYAKLEGADHYFDAFVSRLSAQTSLQAETQVAKIIRYERDPDLVSPDADWYHMGTGVGSSEGEWSGYTDCERTLLLRDMLLDYTYTAVDEICDPGATQAMFANAINDGRSVVNYIGHGSGYGWGTTGFGNSNVHQLVNGSMNPVIIDVACSNGTFTYNESFAEAWLRTGSPTEPRGAVAMYASSGLCSWVPPCIMQHEVIRVLTAEETSTIGGICFAGAMHVLEQEGPGAGREVAEQYNMFGDCSMLMRTDVPTSITVEHDGTLPEGETTYEVTVPGISGALVALYADGTLYGSAYTDEQGSATIQLTQLPEVGTMLTLTVTGYNTETLLEQVEVIIPTLAEIVIEGYDLFDTGVTENGQIEAGEQILLDITVTNVGIELASGVTATLNSGSEWITMVDAEASFGDIPPGESATSDEPYVFDVAPEATDGDNVSFTMDISAEAGHWEHPLGFVVHRPDLVVNSIEIDDAAGNGNGRIDPGEMVHLTVAVSNDGSGDGAELLGTLSVGTPLITATQNQGEIAYLAAQGSDAFQPPFTIVVSQLMRPTNVMFFVNTQGANGFQEFLSFSLPVGEESSSVDDLAGRDHLYLAPASPNPASPGTQLAFVLPEAGRVDLTIFDAAGRRVKTIVDTESEAGVHRLVWDGRDANGHWVSSGVYFAQLRSGPTIQTRRLTVLR